jgi:hypothetical protein
MQKVSQEGENPVFHKKVTKQQEFVDFFPFVGYIDTPNLKQLIKLF